MTLRLALQDLEKALDASMESPEFVREINSATKGVHEYVWQEVPENELVRNRVLPLMKDACRLVRELYDSSRAYETIAKRIVNIQRHANGQYSDFARDMATAA